MLREMLLLPEPRATLHTPTLLHGLPVILGMITLLHECKVIFGKTTLLGELPASLDGNPPHRPRSTPTRIALLPQLPVTLAGNPPPHEPLVLAPGDRPLHRHTYPTGRRRLASMPTTSVWTTGETRTGLRYKVAIPLHRRRRHRIVRSWLDMAPTRRTTRATMGGFRENHLRCLESTPMRRMGSTRRRRSIKAPHTSLQLPLQDTILPGCRRRALPRPQV
jgi:hypothetical protein